jgi:competence protein ComEC
MILTSANPIPALRGTSVFLPSRFLLGFCLCLGASCLESPHVFALEWSSDDLYIRLVDVGPGLCAVAIAPGKHLMVYDAGHWNGRHCLAAVRDIEPEAEAIDLLVISHSDADHLGDAARILQGYRVLQIVHTGDARDTNTWRVTRDAIQAEGANGATILDLSDTPVEPGTVWQLGPAKVTFIAGWHEWTETNLSLAERRNAISIVVRLDFNGRSILFAGDTIGRRRGDNNKACKDAEKIMVANRQTASIDADVVTAPHHGGNNASSNCFIRAVSPD